MLEQMLVLKVPLTLVTCTSTVRKVSCSKSVVWESPQSFPCQAFAAAQLPNCIDPLPQESFAGCCSPSFPPFFSNHLCSKLKKHRENVGGGHETMIGRQYYVCVWGGN